MTTKDIYLASYINTKHPVVDYHKEGRIILFKFDISKEEEKKIRIEFMSSEYNQIKTRIEKLKMLGE